MPGEANPRTVRSRAAVANLLSPAPPVERASLPALVVDIEREESEIVPQAPRLPAFGTIANLPPPPGPSSSRAGPSSAGQPTETAAPLSEVICLDDTPPRPAHPRSESGSRKMRRLNNSTPVIVVSDDEDGGVQPVQPPQSSIPAITPGIGPTVRRASRADRRVLPQEREVPAPVRRTARAERLNPTEPNIPQASRRLFPPDDGLRIEPAIARRRRAPIPFWRSRTAIARSLGGPSVRDMPTINTRTRSSQLRLPSRLPRSGPLARQTRTVETNPAQSSAVPAPPLGPAASFSFSTQPLAAAGSGANPVGAGHVDHVTMTVGVRARHRAGAGSSNRRAPRLRAIRGFSSPMLQQMLREHIAQHGGSVGVEFRVIHQNQSMDYESLVRLDEQLMRQRNAAPKDIISSLPTMVATTDDLDTRCVVCMCDVEEGEVLRELPCKHRYHKKCIDGKCLCLICVRASSVDLLDFNLTFVFFFIE